MTAAAVTIAKLLLTAYFSFARMQGATKEELIKLYSDAKDEFDQNNPSELEDV